MTKAENFRPISNLPPRSVATWIRFYGRMILDFQILSVYRDLRHRMPSFSGKILDVGCGSSPYRHLLNGSKTQYYGIDVVDAKKFDYANHEIVPFNGEDIPFENETFNGMICTEVLEHVQNYQKLVNEMHRVLKKDGEGIITVPWSARYHYIPFDFFRYTPSSLKSIFGNFSEVVVRPRGTDIVAIVSKIVVVWFRNLAPSQKWKWVLVPLWVALTPLVCPLVLVAHLALWAGLGSKDDPIGYTVLVKK